MAADARGVSGNRVIGAGRSRAWAAFRRHAPTPPPSRRRRRAGATPPCGRAAGRRRDARSPSRERCTRPSTSSSDEPTISRRNCSISDGPDHHVGDPRSRPRWWRRRRRPRCPDAGAPAPRPPPAPAPRRAHRRHLRAGAHPRASSAAQEAQRMRLQRQPRRLVIGDHMFRQLHQRQLGRAHRRRQVGEQRQRRVVAQAAHLPQPRAPVEPDAAQRVGLRQRLQRLAPVDASAGERGEIREPTRRTPRAPPRCAAPNPRGIRRSGEIPGAARRPARSCNPIRSPAHRCRAR